MVKYLKGEKNQYMLKKEKLGNKMLEKDLKKLEYKSYSFCNKIPTSFDYKKATESLQQDLLKKGLSFENKVHFLKERGKILEIKSKNYFEEKTKCLVRPPYILNSFKDLNNKKCFIDIFLKERTEKLVIKNHKKVVSNVLFLKDYNDLLISSSYDGKIYIVDFSNGGKNLRLFKGHKKGINILKQHKDEILSICFDNEIKIWDLQYGKCKYKIKLDNEVRDIFFDENIIRLFDSKNVLTTIYRRSNQKETKVKFNLNISKSILSGKKLFFSLEDSLYSYEDKLKILIKNNVNDFDLSNNKLIIKDKETLEIYDLIKRKHQKSFTTKFKNLILCKKDLIFNTNDSGLNVLENNYNLKIINEKEMIYCFDVNDVTGKIAIGLIGGEIKIF